MYITAAGAVVVITILWMAARQLKPTRFGLVFGLMLFYIPLHYKVPLNAFPMVNALTVGMAALFKLRPEDRGALLRRASAFRALAVGFLALCTFGLFMSVMRDPGAVMETTVEFKRWLDPLLFGLLALAMTKDEDRKFSIACMMIGYAIVAVHGIREGMDYGANKRIPGILGQPNETGAFLAMYAPFGLTLALLMLRGRLRLVLIAVSWLGGWALIPTLSRGSWLAYGVGMIVSLLASKKKGLAITGILIGAVLYAVPDLLPERVTARFEETVVEEGQPGEALEDTLEPSAAARITQWKSSIEAMATNPIGFGFRQFKKVIGNYGGISGLDAHNFFFLAGVEFGIAGFVIAVALFLKMGANAWAVARNATDPFTRSFGTACCAMTVAAIITNCVGSRLMQDQPSTYLWVLSAIAVRMRDGLETAATAHAAQVAPGSLGMMA